MKTHLLANCTVQDVIDAETGTIWNSIYKTDIIYARNVVLEMSHQLSEVAHRETEVEKKMQDYELRGL